VQFRIDRDVNASDGGGGHDHFRPARGVSTGVDGQVIGPGRHVVERKHPRGVRRDHAVQLVDLNDGVRNRIA
jgi:hypothetical protein